MHIIVTSGLVPVGIFHAMYSTPHTTGGRTETQQCHPVLWTALLCLCLHCVHAWCGIHSVKPSTSTPSFTNIVTVVHPVSGLLTSLGTLLGTI